MMNIEFLPDTHTYLVNGKIIPSATQIVNWKYAIYKDVPPEILHKKAEYGTRVHELCEKLANKEITLDKLPTKSVDIISACYDFSMLMKKMCFYPKKMEEYICYRKKVCGAFDVLTEDDVLIDLKTTSQLHVDKIGHDGPLNLQLSIYALALGVNDAYYIWLPKGKKAKCERVNLWEKEEVDKVINEYYQEYFTKR